MSAARRSLVAVAVVLVVVTPLAAMATTAADRLLGAAPASDTPVRMIPVAEGAVLALGAFPSEPPERRALVGPEATPAVVPPIEPALTAAVDAAGGLPASGDGATCAAADLVLSWDAPIGDYTRGAYVEPLGPAPDGVTTAVNGLVLCADSDYAFMGFEAYFVNGAWEVGFIPDPEGELGDHEHEANDPDVGAPEASVEVEPPTASTLEGAPLRTAGIEGYARYDGQSTCDPNAKTGTLALRDLLLTRYPGTRSLGITRGCSVGGRSEHKEGRAFDWGALVTRANEKAAVDDFVARLLATDADGNAHALARRMGVMYVIWNRQIWSAYSANAGWRAYNGSSPHTDHVHISLSWAGARGETSFWSGTVVKGLPARPVGGGSHGHVRRRADTGTDGAGATGTTDGERDRRHDGNHGGTEDRRARWDETRDPRERDEATTAAEARTRAEAWWDANAEDGVAVVGGREVTRDEWEAWWHRRARGTEVDADPNTSDDDSTEASGAPEAGTETDDGRRRRWWRDRERDGEQDHPGDTASSSEGTPADAPTADAAGGGRRGDDGWRDRSGEDREHGRRNRGRGHRGERSGG